MKPARATVRWAAALALLALAACNRSDAPSDDIKHEAENIVQAVEAGAPAISGAAESPFAPRDECSALVGGAPFLAALKAAVEMRDTAVLVALSANDVKLGFGGQDGAANLRTALDAEGSVLWNELAEMIPMGCAANDTGGMTIPYYFDQSSSLDPFEAMIVTGMDVQLREAPGDEAPVMASLTWREVAKAPEPSGQGAAAISSAAEGWTKVRVPARGEAREMLGYIRSEDLRSMVDYRLLASSRNGRWRITALLAGD